MLPSDGPTKPGASRSPNREGSASEPGDGTVRRDSAGPTAAGPVSAEAVSARLAIDGRGLATDWDDLLDLLDNLEKDHYIVRDGEGDRMSSALLARIWRHHRRLA